MKKEGLSLINTKDVVTIKLPYPNISSNLAVNSHMYICYSKVGHDCKFVKCQTLKPSLIKSGVIRHYHDEVANLSRNPFKHSTRIDCDKLFCSNSVLYDLRLKTSSRGNVCDDVFNCVENELLTDGYASVHINETSLIALNPLISKV